MCICPSHTRYSIESPPLFLSRDANASSSSGSDLIESEATNKQTNKTTNRIEYESPSAPLPTRPAFRFCLHYRHSLSLARCTQMDDLRDLRLADSLSSPTTLGIVTMAAMAVAAVYLTSHKARDSCSTAEQHQRAELYRRLSSVVLAGRHHVPCMLVDLEQFDRNAAAFVEITTRANKRIRVASKSIRVPYLIERFVRRHSEHVSGLMCFSWPEAAFLANECRLASLDMMVAYPTMLESDVELQLELIAQHGAHFHAMVDSLEHLALIERVCRQRRASHPDEQFKATVCIDVDMSYHVAGYLSTTNRPPPDRSIDRIRSLIQSVLQTAHWSASESDPFSRTVRHTGSADPRQRVLGAEWRHGL